MSERIQKGDVLQRMAGISFIVGAVLMMAVNILFPRASDPSDAKAWLQAWANAGNSFKVLNLAMAIGMWALFIGAVGIYRSHTTGGAAAWTRLGCYGVLVGIALWTLMAVQGIGMSAVLAQWGKSAEPAKGALFQAATALMEMDNALFSMSIIVFWLALAFQGVGMLLGAIFPRGLGWALVILGGVMVVAVGVPQLLAGQSVLVTSVLFPALAGLSLIWALIAGIWILRKAW